MLPSDQPDVLVCLYDFVYTFCIIKCGFRRIFLSNVLCAWTQGRPTEGGVGAMVRDYGELQSVEHVPGSEVRNSVHVHYKSHHASCKCTCMFQPHRA